MFPHATCMCVSAAQKSGQNVKLQVFQSHQDNQVTATENQKQFQESNSWIIQRHVDFIKISVLSSAQASAILQKSQRQRLCNRQVNYVSNSFNLAYLLSFKTSITIKKTHMYVQVHTQTHSVYNGKNGRLLGFKAI